MPLPCQATSSSAQFPRFLPSPPNSRNRAFARIYENAGRKPFGRRSGVPAGNRTRNLQRRRLSLYPIALRTHILAASSYSTMHTACLPVYFIIANIFQKRKKNDTRAQKFLAERTFFLPAADSARLRRTQSTFLFGRRFSAPPFCKTLRCVWCVGCFRVRDLRSGVEEGNIQTKNDVGQHL